MQALKNRARILFYQPIALLQAGQENPRGNPLLYIIPNSHGNKIFRISKFASPRILHIPTYTETVVKSED